MISRVLVQAQEAITDIMVKVRAIPNETVDQIGVAVSSKTTWAGALGGFAGWVASVNWLGVAGLLIAIAGFLTNLYFARRRDKREEVESAARIAALKSRRGK